MSGSMKRKIYDRMLKWKHESEGRTALLIEGARRVGKSFIVKEFADNEYRSSIIINFGYTTKSVRLLFENGTSDVREVIDKLEHLSKVTLYERESLIVFDEVQKCPRAREMIKYLVEDGRFDYIETGSLISIRENVKDIIIPSEEERISMYPMDFEEFCWAMGDTVTVPNIRRHFEESIPMGQDIHESTMESFRKYMLVGGMPQAVAAYADSRDFHAAETQKRAIVALYSDDVRKSNGKKAASIFRAIPSDLQKHDKTITLSDHAVNPSFSDFEDALYWLEDSMISNLCYNSTEPSIGLKLKMDRSTVKCYMGDTGLLVTMSIDDNEDTEHDVYSALLTDNLHFNEGMFTENIVAQILRFNGHRLYFHSFYDRERSNNRYEVDFLIRSGNKIAPIEVKSGASTRHASLDLLMEKYPKHIGQSYVLCTKDLKKDGILLYIPLYMAICL